MGVHDGHRKRMKRLFIEHGLDGFEDHRALELLLFYAIPQKDVNPLAHQLINIFGGLSGVFEATHDELMKVDGIGENAAALIRLLPKLCRKYMSSAAQTGQIIDSSEKAGEFIRPFYIGEREEVVYIICLDSKFKLITCRELSRGIVNAADINVRKMVETVLVHNAANAVIFHNHISGIALPSLEDEVTTKNAKKALNMVGVRLLDHIISAGEDFISMKDSGYFS